MLTRKFHESNLDAEASGATGGPSTQRTIALVAAPLIEIAASNARELQDCLREERIVVQAATCASDIGRKHTEAFGCRGMSPSETVTWMTAVDHCDVIVVGVTFNSLYYLLEALSKSSLKDKMLLFVDEAHRTAGPVCSADTDTGRPLAGSGTLKARNKSFPEFYKLFDMIISLTATPKVHPDNDGKCGGREADTQIYGNGLKYCGLAKDDLKVKLDGGNPEDSDDEGASGEGEEDSVSESGPSCEAASDSASQEPPPKKRKGRLPYHPHAFNCQNDAWGSYGPILISLNRERALEEGITVKEYIRLIGGDPLEPNLEKDISSWKNCEDAGGIWKRPTEGESEDGQFSQNAKDLEIRRICLLWIVLLDVAAGEHTHVACFFSRQGNAKAGAKQVKFLAGYMADLLHAKPEETCKAYGLDLEDVEAAKLRLQTLAKNCYVLISSDNSRRGILDILDTFRKNDVALITSVHMLKIGVDVPHMSAAVHCDPMSEPTNIEQANGRVRRAANLRILRADGSFQIKKKEYCTIYTFMQMDVAATIQDVKDLLSKEEEKQRQYEEEHGLESDEGTVVLRQAAAEAELCMMMFRAVIRRSREKGDKSIIVGLLQAALSSSGGGSKDNQRQGGLYKTRKIQLRDLTKPRGPNEDGSAEIDIDFGDTLLEQMLQECTKRPAGRQGENVSVAFALGAADKVLASSEGKCAADRFIMGRQKKKKW
jgi:hypothetical protein